MKMEYKRYSINSAIHSNSIKFIQSVLSGIV